MEVFKSFRSINDFKQRLSRLYLNWGAVVYLSAILMLQSIFDKKP